jgi:predicted MFS family arabinose efflux permease
VPYAGDRAGLLLAAGAAGMMCGDLLVGRFLTAEGRRRSNTALRLLLAAPFLFFVAEPGVPVAVLLVAVASAGYGASLAQQEWLVALSPVELRGQVLGVEGAARMTAQGVGAVLAGGLADLVSAAPAMSALGAASLLVSLSLSRPLARAAASAGVRRPDALR